MLGKTAISRIFSGLGTRVMLVVTLALVPPLGMVVLTTVLDRRHETRSIESQTLQLAESIAVEEEQWIEGTRQLLVALAHTSQVKDPETSACSAFLGALVEEYDNYINFGVLDPQGTVRCSASPIPDTLNVVDQPYFQRALEFEGFAIGECHVSPLTKRSAVTFGQPIVDREGAVRGVFFATLDLAWLNHRDTEELVRQLPQGASLTEVDTAGVVLVHQPNSDAWVGKSAAETPLVRAVLSRKQGVMRATGLDGQPGIYAYAPVHSQVRGDEMYILVGIPDEIALADGRRIFKRNILVLGFVMAIGLTGGWFLSDAVILRRGRALLAAARDLGRGDLSARTGVPHDESELGRLAAAFDRMAETLEQREFEREQTENHLRRQAERLEILRTVDGADLATQSLEDIAREALEHVRRSISCLRATVLLFDWDANEMIRLATSGIGNASLENGGRLPLDPFLDAESHPGALMLAGGSRSIDPSRSRVDRELFQEGIRTYTVVHLTANGQQVGALTLGLGSDQELSPANLELAEEIADSLAVPIQNARLLEEVRASREHLRFLSRRLLEAQEVERRHVARELHDQIGQIMTSIKISLQSMERLPHRTSFEPHLSETIETVDRALKRVRDLSLDLRPSVLDDLGLAAALESYVERLSERTGISAHCFVEPLETPVSPTLEITCFRIAQEALTNVVRHAQAKNVWIEVQERKDELHLTVSDDGVGFDVLSTLRYSAHKEHLGLMGMQERVALMGGEIEIDSGLGRGTEIIARLPLVSKRDHDQEEERRR